MFRSARIWLRQLRALFGDQPNRRPEPPRLTELEARLLPTGTWTPLVNKTPSATGTDTMILLSNGTVMAMEGNDNPVSKKWDLLTPDNTGSYVNGTWAASVAPMNTQRLFFASNVLQDGRVFVLGGEYSGPAIAQNFNNTGQIYNPVTNVWTSIKAFPQAQFGDDPSALLPNGNILLGFVSGPETYIYNPTTNTYSAPILKLRNDQSDEETWVKLPDGSILSYDVFSSDTGPGIHAQRFVPSLNKWVDAGTPPALLSSAAAVGSELGPALLLPNGLVLQIGANNLTALYNPRTNSWTAGPSLPANLGADDAPGAILPNGDLIFAVDTSQPNPPGFTPPTKLFDYNFQTNTVSAVPTPAALTAQLNATPAFDLRMTVLPSGQMLLSTGNRTMFVYTPNGGPQNAWRPTISHVVDNGNGTFTLTGTQLNGISEGSSFGDDVENSTNFPIVQIKDSAGHILYARTFNWSSTGVATGSLVVSTQFTLPAGISIGAFTVTVIANGIPSLNSVTLPGDVTSLIRVLYPIRYVFDPRTGTFKGDLTIQNLSALSLQGPFQIQFPALPPGVTLANPTGLNHGVPFIRVVGNLAPGGSLHITISLRDPFGVPLSSFFVGFPVKILQEG